MTAEMTVQQNAAQAAGEDTQKDYVVVVQCGRVTAEVCPGFQCEWAFARRADAFSRYPKEKAVRYLPMSCGGCPGRAVLRKLLNLKKNLLKREDRGPAGAVVHLASCITKANHHGPRCPHIDYLKTQIHEAGFDCVEDSRLSPTAERRRADGRYDGESACAENRRAR